MFRLVLILLEIYVLVVFLYSFHASYTKDVYICILTNKWLNHILFDRGCDIKRPIMSNGQNLPIFLL